MTGAAASDADAAAHPAWQRIALGGGAGMFVGMGLGRFSYTAMVPALVESGALTAVQAGRVGMTNLFGFVAGAALSARLLRVASIQRILGIAIVLSALSLAASALPYGFSWLVVWRGLVGLTTGITMVLSLALITATAPERKRSLAASYMFAGVGVGVLSSGLLVPWLLHYGLAAAWSGLAAICLVGVALAIWGWAASPDLRPPSKERSTAPVAWAALSGLLVAHALFSLGIVPHTLYWVDYLVRGLGNDMAAGGLHWSLVGIFSAVGPFLAAWLVQRVGAAWALVIAFVVLGIGIGTPALWPVLATLVASSVIFGAQPGMSTIMAVRARELGTAEAMPRVMRAMILANACGAVIGGLAVPALYGATESHAVLFVVGGVAMFLGAVACWPRR